MRLALAVLLALLAAGCSSAPTTTAPDCMVADNEQAIWRQAYDAPWRAALACWHADVSPPAVYERDDCIGGHWFLDDWGRPVHGYYLEAYGAVVVCPDLASLPHEMSHHVLEMLDGNPGVNTDRKCGCFDVVRG